MALDARRAAARSAPTISSSNVTVLLTGLLFLLLLAGVPRGVDGHIVFRAPVARSASSALKLGPCGAVGSVTDDRYTRTTISPGPLEIRFQETVTHPGGPFRLALSQEGDESTFADCVLLDHIPNDHTGILDGLYKVTVTIPNVTCAACSLQLLQVMTDKIPQGATCTYDPECTSCTYYRGNRTHPACFSNYHSCANVAIVGGAEPRAQHTCAAPAASFLHPNLTQCVPELYTQESAVWNTDYEVVSIESPCQTSQTPGSASSPAPSRAGALLRRGWACWGVVAAALLVVSALGV